MHSNYITDKKLSMQSNDFISWADEKNVTLNAATTTTTKIQMFTNNLIICVFFFLLPHIYQWGGVYTQRNLFLFYESRFLDCRIYKIYYVSKFEIGWPMQSIQLRPQVKKNRFQIND